MAKAHSCSALAREANPTNLRLSRNEGPDWPKKRGEKTYSGNFLASGKQIFNRKNGKVALEVAGNAECLRAVSLWTPQLSG